MKRSIVFSLSLVCVFFVLASCQAKPDPADYSPGIIDRGHNARNSLDYEGSYSGVIPAASGPGIFVRLTLDYGDTFELEYYYIDRSGPVFTAGGTFAWDDEGLIIDLGLDNFPSYYFVGENHIIQLDMEGRRIVSPIEQNYILRMEPR